MRLALVTDAWHPQTNGVVRTLDTTVGRLRQAGLDDHIGNLPFQRGAVTRFDSLLNVPRQAGHRLQFAAAQALHIGAQARDIAKGAAKPLAPRGRCAATSCLWCRSFPRGSVR